jgi:hypothetical protein
MAPITSKTLVNSRSSKVVNIASMKLMKKIFAGPDRARIVPGRIVPGNVTKMLTAKATGNFHRRHSRAMRFPDAQLRI